MDDRSFYAKLHGAGIFRGGYYDFFDSVRGGGRGSVHARMRAAHRGGLRHFFLPARGTAAAFYRELYLHGDTKMLRTARYDGARCIGNHPAAESAGACLKRGVLVGVIDTGVDYTNPLFGYSDGSSRILRIWDQTIQDGTPPEGILYGAEYRKEEIDEALQAERPYDVVPSRDENGHGTFVTGVVCGGGYPERLYRGGAKRWDCRCKAKRGKALSAGIFSSFRREFLPSGDGSDDGGILFKWRCKCVEYAACDLSCARQQHGGHGTDGPLPNFLNYISTRRRRSIVTATGNEANTRHHFRGALRREMDYEDVEISVEQDMAGFFIELWAGAPELYAISVISPTGERIPKVSLRSGASKSFRFVFEGTTVSVDYRIETKETANQLIYLRFSDVRRGLWIVRVTRKIL